MMKCLDWQGRSYPSHSAEFVQHQFNLSSHGWGFNDLKEVTESQWKEIRIQGGFVKKILKQIKEWQRLPDSQKVVREQRHLQETKDGV